jgi:uncharacterized protein (TIGR00369 family)
MSTLSPVTSPLSVADVTRIIDDAYPGIHAGGRRLVIESVADRAARVRLLLSERSIRPGGTISGPAMFTLADFSIYVALLATLGASAVQSVTSNLNITFLMRPEPTDVIAEVRVIRIGKRLSYSEVNLFSEGRPDAIAHATATYAMPPSTVK